MNEAMSDPLDVASNNEQVNCEMKVKEIQVEANKPIPKLDNCLWCGMKTRNGARWCNRECCSHWERYGRQ